MTDRAIGVGIVAMAVAIAVVNFGWAGFLGSAVGIFLARRRQS